MEINKTDQERLQETPELSAGLTQAAAIVSSVLTSLAIEWCYRRRNESDANLDLKIPE